MSRDLLNCLKRNTPVPSPRRKRWRSFCERWNMPFLSTAMASPRSTFTSRIAARTARALSSRDGLLPRSESSKPSQHTLEEVVVHSCPKCGSSCDCDYGRDGWPCSGCVACHVEANQAEAEYYRDIERQHQEYLEAQYAEYLKEQATQQTDREERV